MKELYNRIKEGCELPITTLSYIYKSFEGGLVMGYLVLNFNETDEHNINEMKTIEGKYGEFFVEWYLPKKMQIN